MDYHYHFHLTVEETEILGAYQTGVRMPYLHFRSATEELSFSWNTHDVGVLVGIKQR